MWYILTVLILLVHSVLTIDLLPCTDEVNPAEMALARRLLEQSTPPGYRLIEVEPISQTGRNPHRWIGHFERLDDVYNTDCHYLAAARSAFRQLCPLGSEISQIGVCRDPQKRAILVQYLVNCPCRKIIRRRSTRSTIQYVRERSTCSGISNYHSYEY